MRKICTTLALLIGFAGGSCPALADIEIHRCIDEAAQAHGVDKNLIWAIKLKESAHRTDEGIRHVNENGSEDLGPMQVNSLWLPYLKARGIGREHLMGGGCEGVHAGTMILSDLIRQYGPEEAAGYYHSATPKFKEPYQADVVAMWHRLNQGESPNSIAPGRIISVAGNPPATPAARRSQVALQKYKNPFVISLM